MATERIDVNLNELRSLQDRIGQQKLEARDFPIVGALVTNLIIREENKIEQLKEKIAAEAENTASTPENNDTEVSSPSIYDNKGAGFTVSIQSYKIMHMQRSFRDYTEVG